jgi:hypothetical protein
LPVLPTKFPAYELHDDKGVDSCADVINDDACAFGEPLELANWRRLDHVEGSEQYKADEEWLPNERSTDESDHLSGDFVNDDLLRIFATGTAGDKGGGGDAERGNDECDSGRDPWLSSDGS